MSVTAQHWIGQLSRPVGFVRTLSIRSKTLAALAVLLSCFAVLGVNSWWTMRSTSEKLKVLGDRTLPQQTVAMDLSNDIIATHMKVFRFVTLASNGVTRKLLDPLYAEVLSELEGETVRLKILAERRDVPDGGKAELEFITTQWVAYQNGVRDLLEVGRTDAPMAAIMLGATDEDFQTIAAHLNAMSAQVNERTASLVADMLVNVDTNRTWLAFGGAAGMVISVLVALGFIRSLVKPIVAVTQAMQKVSAGAVDVQIGYQGRQDEVGQMMTAIEGFRRTTQLHVETIATQNRRFDAALNNMSHGVCMFDASGTLIVHNQRYLEIYGMPCGSIAPGFTVHDILRVLSELGAIKGYDRYLDDVNAAMAQAKPMQSMRELKDGRVIHVFNRPMPGGGWITTHEDVTERIRNEQRVAYMARHDILTGLPNRLHFRERMEEMLPHLRRGGRFAVLCLDLDHFKEVNDTLGHPCGDKLLKMVAERLRQNVREVDVLSRLGGDEFAIVQKGAQSAEEITVAGRRIVEVLSEPYQIDGHEVVIGTSVGIAMAPDDGDDPDLLLKNADMALYRAKADGRGTVRFFEADMDVRIQARHKLETELRKALAQGEFEVFFQPMIDLEANCVAVFEALIRWNHPERGLVSPAVFISAAEDIGLIGPIGEWVLHQACAQATCWPRHVRVAVNLSPSQFRKTLVPTVVQALKSSGLQPERLELEITESALLQNSEATLSILHQLRHLGVSICLDDFGTGYSSLSYLHSFPFDKIKIDRSFVSDVGENSHCAAIVRAVTGLGRSLNIKTTAEGVETVEQLEWLRAERCTEVQGYLFSVPLPAADLPELMRSLEWKLSRFGKPLLVV